MKKISGETKDIKTAKIINITIIAIPQADDIPMGIEIENPLKGVPNITFIQPLSELLKVFDIKPDSIKIDTTRVKDELLGCEVVIDHDGGIITAKGIIKVKDIYEDDEDEVDEELPPIVKNKNNQFIN